MKYLEFYEMEVEPFSNAPVSRFFYNSAPHSKALVRLLYAIESMKGLAVLIGDIGSGKTTLARRLLDSLPEEEYESALLVIIHSGVDAKWLLKRVAIQLGVEEPSEEKLALLGQLYQRLIEIHEEGRKAVVLIDEAQMLASREIMEEFRGLMNLELPDKKLLSVVFFGLPALEQSLLMDPPLAQRIAVKYYLDSLDEQTTEDYIKHRLRLAGAKRMLFTKEATQMVYHYSHGIPRLINTICDNALFEGSILKSPLIEAPLVATVCTDLGLGRPEGLPRSGGTRAEDFATPRENQEPSPVEKPREARKSNVPPRRAIRERNEEDGEEEMKKAPLLDEIDGILDNLIDKV